ncbi:MAG TPA: hypothetical protein VF432_18205 [Thermoanaerobaculia bacterium]
MHKMNEAPGMPCPRCGYRITVTLQDLSTASAVICSGCALRLELDRGRSQAALELVRKLRVAMENVEAVRRFSV